MKKFNNLTYYPFLSPSFYALGILLPLKRKNQWYQGYQEIGQLAYYPDAVSNLILRKMEIVNCLLSLLLFFLCLLCIGVHFDTNMFGLFFAPPFFWVLYLTSVIHVNMYTSMLFPSFCISL